jgi:hypothetical protein
LDRAIDDDEIKTVVRQTPPEKAPGPDGYISPFYKTCWNIVKGDMQGAIREVFDLWGSCWNLLNLANVMLLPKKEGAQSIGDYKPISVMHNVSKILGKILANRLVLLMDGLVSHCQSAFIWGRSIPDNFQYVQGAVKHFHQAKMPMLFIKLDIAKAFDSVRWEYLLEVMEQLGFR